MYDAGSTQAIPISFEHNGKTVRVVHNLNPLSTERFFDFQEQSEQTLKRSKKVSTALFAPKDKLWTDLIESVEGYKPRDDWKDRIDQAERLAAVNALLHVTALSGDEIEDAAEDTLYDPDELTAIHFQTMYGGALITMIHKFRPDSKAERDEFLSIQANQPIENEIASATQTSKAEKLYRLGKKLLVETEGYADGSDVPAWHLPATVESYFARHLAKMGKL